MTQEKPEENYSTFSIFILGGILCCLLALYLNYRGVFPTYSEEWSRYEFDPGTFPEEINTIDPSFLYTSGEFVVGEDIEPGEYRLISSSNAARTNVEWYENEDTRHSVNIRVAQPSRLTVKEGNVVSVSQDVVAVPIDEIGEVDLNDSPEIINEGFYKVGEEIDPGTYIFSQGARGSGTLEVYANGYFSEDNRLQRIGYFPDLQTEITVNEGEYLFVQNALMDETYDPFEHTDRPRNDEVLGRLQLDPEKDIYWEGVYEIGIDIPEGEYRLYVVNEEQGATGQGEFTIYDNYYRQGSSQTRNAFHRFGYVTVEEGEFLTLNNLLAVPIEQASFEEAIDGKYLQGLYQVGYDIAPGTYTVHQYSGNEPDSYYPEPAYVGVLNVNERLLSSRSVDEEFEGTYTVTVEEGQWLKIDGAYLAEEEVETNWNHFDAEEQE